MLEVIAAIMGLTVIAVIIYTFWKIGTNPKGAGGLGQATEYRSQVAEPTEESCGCRFGQMCATVNL